MTSRCLEVSGDGVLHDVGELHHVHRLVSRRRRRGSVASHVTTNNNNNVNMVSLHHFACICLKTYEFCVPLRLCQQIRFHSRTPGGRTQMHSMNNPCYFYRSPTKLRESNVFSNASLSIGGRVPVQGSRSTLSFESPSHDLPCTRPWTYPLTCSNLFNLDLTLQGPPP